MMLYLRTQSPRRRCSPRCGILGERRDGPDLFPIADWGAASTARNHRENSSGLPSRRRTTMLREVKNPLEEFLPLLPARSRGLALAAAVLVAAPLPAAA